MITSYDKNGWRTPMHILDVAYRVMGGIDLDPASSIFANSFVSADVWCGPDHPNPEQRDGLAFEWFGKVWLNPPYGRGHMIKWAQAVVKNLDNIEQACVLTNCDPSTKWFQLLLDNCDAFVLLSKRTAFLHPTEQRIVPGGKQAQTLFYFGKMLADKQASLESLGTVCFKV